MASSQIPLRNNPNSSVAGHDHAADTASSDNENQHAEGLNSNVAAHAQAADGAFSGDKDEPTEEAKYSNPINGHLPPQPYVGPPVDLIEDQQGRVKWLPGYDFFSDPLWAEDPDVAAIKTIVAAHTHLIGLDKDDVEVEYLAEGSYNKLYTIRKASLPPGTGPEYIFRVCLATYPWYKLESEIATMELVRMYTNIPVPKVYVYDSDADNPVQNEWMIMDQVRGIPFREARKAMEMEQKTKLAHTLADWMHQLSTLRFNKIGSIYRRRKKPATSKDDFKVGPIIDIAFMPDWRLEYKLHRGPYISIEQYLRAFVEVNLADVIDPRQNLRSEYCAARNELKWMTLKLDDCDDRWDQEMARKFQGQWDAQPPEAKQAHIDQLRNHVTSYEARHDEDTETVVHVHPRYTLVDVNGNRKPDVFPRAAAQCQALLFAIPKLCPAEVLSEASTVLHHWDVSADNVLVDAESGAAIALVDWEQVQALPYALIHPYPPAINDKYDRNEPPKPLRPNADDDDRYMYQYELDLYENFLLRKAFRQRLEELQSPHLEAFEEREPDLKDLLALARVSDHPFIRHRVKELVEKLEEHIGF